MVRIVVIGTGNLGTQLCYAFDKESTTTALVGYFNKSNHKIPSLRAPLYKNFNNLPACDLVLICTPDDVVETVSNAIQTTAIVAHTSGSVPLSSLNKHERHGVFYLPQTFSKSRPARFNEITLCLEASSTVVMELLAVVGSTLSRKRTHLNTVQRKHMHLAAVYANNFVNHCYLKTEQLLGNQQLSLDLLLPLMQETLEKAIALGPLDAQTGPAKRADLNTLKSHKTLLHPNDLDMYEAITQSILNTYGTKL